MGSIETRPIDIVQRPGLTRHRAAARSKRVLRCTLVLALLTLPFEAQASHFRHSHITWRPTGNPSEVVFNVSSSFRRGAPGTHPLTYVGNATDGGLAVGDTFSEYIGATRLFFGDGGSTPTLIYQVDSINTVEDWILAHAINPATGAAWRHTYPGAGPFTARIDSCCRTAVEINNPNRSYEVSTIVDLSLPDSSPVSSVPPIVPCPLGPCVLPLPAVDVDGDLLGFRLSSSIEAGDFGFTHPGHGTADPLSVGVGGVLAWDSTNFPKGLYSTSVTLEEERGGVTIGKVMLDFLINTDAFLGVAPEFDVPPTPNNAQVFNVAGGTPMSLTMQCSDGDAGDLVTMGHLGLPPGATMSPNNAIGNPATATFDWAPLATQAVTIGLTCVDTLGNRSLPHSFSINVAGILVPPGPDRDNEFFCDGLSINQLIASGVYNVIDNFLGPSRVLTGTPGRDLILAGGLGDKMYGLGDDDCIIGADASDYASGGDGADSIWGWSGADVLEGDAGDDEMDGRDGNDFLLGGPGNDTLDGTDNEDWLRGGDGDDLIFGGDDIDLMDGGPGSDQLFAQNGEDVLDGGLGDDALAGGAGNDVCIVDPADTIPPVGCTVFPIVSSAPRIITPIGDLSLDEAGSLSIGIVADDPDPPGGPEPIPGSALAFSAVHLPPFALLTDHGDRTATLDIVPGPGDAGSYPGVIIKVADDGEPIQADLEVVDITVTGGNAPPLLTTPVGSQVLSENDTLSVLIVATDADPGNTLLFAATGLPPFTTLTNHGDRTATLDIQPGLGDAGQYHGIQIRVADNGVPVLDDSEIFSIIVNGTPNAAPVIVGGIGDQSLQEGQPLSLNLVADDLDVGDTLVFSSQNLPAFATLTDGGNRTAVLAIQPGPGDAGVYVGAIVSVTDDGAPPLNDTEIFSITVTQSTGSVCGNGTLEAGEDCDDGNVVSGDCCNSTCGFETTGSGCDDGDVCTPLDQCDGAGVCVGGGSTCGDGTLDAACGETCDDGNTADGDCCASTCQLEAIGSTCTDGDACTPLDQCDGAGVCVGGGSTCGDGTLDAACGETCDDGNTADGDCCASTCQLEGPGSPCADDGIGCTVDVCDGAGVCLNTPDHGRCDDANVCTDDSCDALLDCQAAPNTAPCDDGDACTSGEVCGGGSCLSGAPVVCAACEACDAGTGGCVPTPQTAPICKTPVAALKSKLQLKDRFPDGRDQVVWKWAKGEATTVGEFGDPANTADYALCIFDESGATPTLLVRATAPAGGVCGKNEKPCWKGLGTPIGAKGFRYADRDATPDGLKKLALKPGEEGRAKILATAKGENIVMPGENTHPPLPLAAPVALRVQLQGNGGCWEATYSDGGVLRNAAQLFQARSDP